RRLSTRSSTPSRTPSRWSTARSEEHTSELQSHSDLVCRLLLEKKTNKERHGRSGSSSTAVTHTAAGPRAPDRHTARCDAPNPRPSGVPHLTLSVFFFLKDRAPPEFYPFPLHAPLPI